MLSEDIAGNLTPLETADSDEYAGRLGATSSNAGTGRQSAAWDMVHAPRNYLALVVAQVFTSGLSFSSVWLATRYLGPEGYGGVVAFIAAAQVVMLVSVNWTAISVARFGCEEFVDTGQIASAFWTRLVILVPNLLLVLAAAPLWLPKLGAILHLPANSTGLVLSLLLANAWWIHIQQSLQGAKLLRLQGWLLSLERAFIFSLLAYLALSGRISVSRVGWLYVFGPAAASVIGVLRLRMLIWRPQLDRALLRRMLRFSIPIIPTALIGYLSTNYLDALFITHFLTQAKLGIYSVAYQLTGLAQQLPLLAGTLLMPLFVTLQTDRRQDRTERFIRQVLPPITLLWGAACAVVAAAGSYLVPFVFGPRFQESAQLLWPLMAASTIAGPALMGYAPITTSTSKTYIQMIGVSLASCANVILNFMLIPRYGLLGCAWATTAAYFTHLTVVSALVHWRVMPKRTWSLEATFPMVLGALYASLFGRSIVALLISLIASGAIALLNFRSFRSAVWAVNDYAGALLSLRAKQDNSSRPAAHRGALSLSTESKTAVIANPTPLAPQQDKSENSTESPLRRPLRVLHLIDVTVSNYFLNNLAEFSPTEEIQMWAVTLAHNQGFVEGLRSRGVPAYALGCSGRTDYFRALRGIRRIINEAQIDIIHTHLFEPTILGLLLARLQNKPLIVTRHDSDAVHVIPGRVKRAIYLSMERLINSHADHIIAPSRAVRDILIEEGAERQKISLIPYGQTTERFDSICSAVVKRTRQELFRDDELALVCVSRLYERKGHRYLFRALASLIKGGLKARLCLVGEGPDRDELIGLVRELGIEEYVDFLGWRDDATAIMAAADVVVHPSLEDALSSALIEALMLEKPIIATDISGARDTLGDGEYGAIVPPADVEALSRALERMIRNPGEARSRARRGRQFILDYMGAERVSREYITCYRSVDRFQVSSIKGNTQKVSERGAVRTRPKGDLIK